MSEDVTIPAVGDSIVEGILARWLVDEGSYVNVDDAIYELETDKISTEVQSPFAGVITFNAQEGDTLPIGAKVAEIDTSASAPAGGAAPAAAAPSAAQAERLLQHLPPQQHLRQALQPIPISNSALRFANWFKTMVLMTAVIPASGKNGRLTKADVESYIANKPALLLRQHLLKRCQRQHLLPPQAKPVALSAPA